jgi:glucose/arabinose dehydrogenase
MELGSAVQPTGTLPGEPAIQLVQVAGGLIDPVNVAAPLDGSGRLFIVERVGRIRIVQDGELLEEPFLDITAEVKTDFLEQGLLGLAFHPSYAENGRFFVYYIDYRTNGDSFLVEFSVSEDDPNVADPASARVLLTHDQPFINHNGGTVKFGPDGYLYWVMGDGGMAGDPYKNAQDLSNLLGKILRIDVDVDNGPGGRPGYAIPEDNPFAGQVIFSTEANNLAQDGSYIPDARPEIYAYGLRNPWEFSFDRDTGDLYIADVGQNAWEEINFLPAGSEPGANFGWPILEGSNCYPPGAECSAFGVLPVAEYENSSDVGCSITGIGSYRGEEFPNLDGIYFVSDFCTGIVWGLTRGEDGVWHFAELLDTSLLVTGAGEDEAGDLYVAACNCQFGRNYDPYADPGGTVWRIVAADQVPEGAETAPTE